MVKSGSLALRNAMLRITPNAFTVIRSGLMTSCAVNYSDEISRMEPKDKSICPVLTTTSNSLVRCLQVIANHLFPPCIHDSEDAKMLTNSHKTTNHRIICLRRNGAFQLYLIHVLVEWYLNKTGISVL